MDKVIRAIQFASEKHRDQHRKNRTQAPYINHPIEVMAILSAYGVEDPDVLAAAVLHDTVEDTNTTKKELIKHFGERVTSIVLECTDDKSLPKVDRKKAQVAKAAHKSTEAKLVKLADKLSNLRDLAVDPPKFWSEDRVRGYVVWAYFVCSQMRGINEKLDKGLLNAFWAFNIVDDSNKAPPNLAERLEAYYALLE